MREPKKLRPINLVQGLLAAAVKGDCSLRLLAGSIGMRLKERPGAGFDAISKPSLWARVNPQAVGFLKSVLAEMVRGAAGRRHALPAIPNITRIVVEDSTILNLDARLARVCPATENQHATGAGLRFQAAFDLVTGEALRLDLTSYKRNDQAACGDIIGLLGPGDLLLRDLGYFASGPLVAIAAQGAHYLSRLPGGRVLHHAREGRPGARIDLLEYLRERAPRPGDIIDIDVVVGSGQKGYPRFASRLVARRVPGAVEAKRLRRLGQEEKRRGNKFSLVYRRLLAWEIYITSLPREDVAAEKVLQIYPLRWRVEIIFKACKSHTALRAIAAHRSNVHHVRAMLYAWLCALVLATATRAFALAVDSRAGELRPNYLSLLKVVPKVFELLGGLMLAGCAPADQILGRWVRQMAYHDCYEAGRRRKNMADRLGEAIGLPHIQTKAQIQVGDAETMLLT